VGFSPILVEHEVRTQAGRITRWTFADLLKLTTNGLISFTDWPLRVWSVVGAAFAGISFVYLAVTLVQTLLFGNPVKGYPTLIMTFLGLGGLQLLSIGMLGTYLARTYIESKRRPRFFISKLSLNSNRGRSLSR
jgi:hypothetical protein